MSEQCISEPPALGLKETRSLIRPRSPTTHARWQPIERWGPDVRCCCFGVLHQARGEVLNWSSTRRARPNAQNCAEAP
eukprot:5069688-Alexandrium_andersonii.AAC.1